MTKSVFPIKIEYQDTKEIVEVKTPQEIQCGRTFVVLKTADELE